MVVPVLLAGATGVLVIPVYDIHTNEDWSYAREGSWKIHMEITSDWQKFGQK